MDIIEKEIHYSFSQLMAVKKGSEYWKWYINNKSRPKNDYQVFGSAFHCYVLEPDKFDDKYATIGKVPSDMMKMFIDSMISNKDLIPDDGERKQIAYSRSGYKYSISQVNKMFEEYDNKAYYEAKINGDKELISNDQFEQIRLMTQSVFNHSLAKELLTNPDNEFEYELNHKLNVGQYSCKAFIDCFNPEYIIDLKTTASDINVFKKSIDEYNYKIQLALYQSICMQTGLFKFPKKSYILAVEKKEPYTTGLFLINYSLSDIDIINKLILDFDKCIAGENLDYNETI